MGISGLNQIQGSVWKILSNDATLKNIVTGIFDYVPSGHPFPFISIGEGTEEMFHTFSRFGRDISLNIHIFSQHEGFKQAQVILDRVVSLLDYNDIEVDDFDVVYLRYANGQRIREPDGITHHINATFEIIMQEG